MTTYAGIDVGLNSHYCCVLDLAKQELRFADTDMDQADTLDWIKKQKPEAACIDCPPKLNNGVLAQALPAKSTRNKNRRVAEFRLGIGGCYGTPAIKPAVGASNAWMASGMDLYQALAKQHNWSVDLGNGAGELLETHPTYAFKALLGQRPRNDEGLVRHNVDPDRLLRPKASIEGHGQRVELLRYALGLLNIPVTQIIQQKWDQRIDWVDATVCALGGYWRTAGTCESVGDPSEGSIYLPKFTSDWTVTKHDSITKNQKHTAVGGGRRAAKFPAVFPQPNNVMLRLGKRAFKKLDGQDTIDVLEHFSTDDECWLPIEGKSKFKLAEGLTLVNHRLCLVVAGKLELELTTGCCVGSISCEIPYPGSSNPWPIQVAHRWVQILDVRPPASPAIQGVAKGKWASNFGTGARGLRWGRT